MLNPRCPSALSYHVTSMMRAGDDSVAIHGRMYTVAAANAATNTIIAGSGIISSAELNKGDWIWVYDATGRLLGSTYVVSVTSVTAPNGIIPATVDTVFQTTFSGYNYLQVKASWHFVHLSGPRL